jgi:nicotinamide mononucleotide transporter
VTSLAHWLSLNGLELTAATLGVVSVFLSVRLNVWSWPVGLLNVVLYSIVFWRSGLYSDMGLQVVYFVLSLYGWYEWLYGGTNKTELPVGRTPPRLWGVVAVVGLGFWALDGRLTSILPGVSLPYFDAATATVSLIAQYFMTRKLLENWALWIVVDIFYVGMFIYKGLYLTAANYAVYLLLAVMGYVAWKRAYSAVPAPESPAAA